MISVKFSFWFRDKNNETVATIKNFNLNKSQSNSKDDLFEEWG